MVFYRKQLKVVTFYLKSLPNPQKGKLNRIIQFSWLNFDLRICYLPLYYLLTFLC